ncbi:hypothetical protein, partial [Pseudomonas viridiflava]|uniref:hypothetical protein n=1 Tax=Pseudomonas viridiflava TaxID=33069 RepID=UPI001980FBC9
PFDCFGCKVPSLICVIAFSGHGGGLCQARCGMPAPPHSVESPLPLFETAQHGHLSISSLDRETMPLYNRLTLDNTKARAEL